MKASASALVGVAALWLAYDGWDDWASTDTPAQPMAVATASAISETRLFMGGILTCVLAR